MQCISVFNLSIMSMSYDICFSLRVAHVCAFWVCTESRSRSFPPANTLTSWTGYCPSTQQMLP